MGREAALILLAICDDDPTAIVIDVLVLQVLFCDVQIGRKTGVVNMPPTLEVH